MPPTVRTLTSAGILFALLLGLTACRAAPEHPSHETKIEPPNGSEGKIKQQLPERSDDERWHRMTQCAEQADRVARREGWIGVQHARDDLTVMGWWNHYSPTYGRCYMEVSYMNQAAKKDKSLPLIYYELYDAFENNVVATCTDASNSGAEWFCKIEDTGPPSDCAACRAFVKERMSK